MQAFERLERDFGAWAGVKNVVGCSSGTAALVLALEALGLPPNSEVLVPDYTMVACPRAVVIAGLTPVFVDCGEDLLMDGGLVNRAIGLGRRPAAVMAVHVYGRRCDMDSIGDVPLGTAVVEDLAEAHGVPPHEATDAACYSFYANKLVAGEEGGAVAFRDPAHAARARELRCLGFTAEHNYTHSPRGHNYRLANCLAKKVLDSLANVAANVAARRQAESWYDAECPGAWRMPPRDAAWVYDLKMPGLTRDRQATCVRALNAAGIAARHGFRPMSEQPEFVNCKVFGNGNAARIAPSILYLPLTPGRVTETSAREAFAILRRLTC